MSQLVRALFFALVISTASMENARAEVPDRVIRDLMTIRHSDTLPTIAWAVEPDDSFQVVTIYARPSRRAAVADRHIAPYWIARRVSGRADQVSNDVRWADSRTCPALEGGIWWLSKLAIPSIYVPAMTPDPPSEGTPQMTFRTDLPVYSVWGTAVQSPNGPGQLRFRAATPPLTEWGDQTMMSLEACWTTTEPDP